MTNPYFDGARAPQYTGGFRICHQCISVVPSAYWDKHVERCNELQDLLEHPTGLDIEDLEPLEQADAREAFISQASDAYAAAVDRQVEGGL